jgi:predicted nucleotidyltransferase
VNIPLKRPWIEAIRRWAAAEPRIAAVYLYGSRAKQTNRENSDIDLAVVLTEKDDDPADAFASFEAPRLTEGLAPNLPVEVHLEFAFADDTRVWPSVRDHGILVWHEGWSAHPLFISRT